MRNLISISCLFVAQMLCQVPAAHAKKVVPPVGVLAVLSSQVASAALRPPHVFSVSAGRTIAANLKQNRAGELLLKWSRVDGARSYVVQICQSPQCEPSRAAGDKLTSSRAEGFTDLATVAETRYLNTSFKRGTTARFRIIAIDAEGRRGIPSVVVAQSAL